MGTFVAVNCQVVAEVGWSICCKTTWRSTQSHVWCQYWYVYLYIFVMRVFVSYIYHIMMLFLNHSIGYKFGTDAYEAFIRGWLPDGTYMYAWRYICSHVAVGTFMLICMYVCMYV